MKKKPFNLTPMSVLIANQMNDLSAKQAFTSLKMLYSKNTQDYSMEFLNALHSAFETPEQVSTIRENGIPFFLDFVRHWPYFLHNQSLIEELIRICPKCSVEEQSEVLKILATKKNLVHPQQVGQHFLRFIQIKDKEQMKPIIGNFIDTCAYVGHTSGYDLEILTTVFRRIYKNPAEVENVTTLLNLMLLLSLSNTATEQWHAKSKAFINNTLDFLEDRFKGY
mmetsp:Transcript_4139/g.6150  ORF Transcript_4139/g.6150 Transcript_4139/m.6150 type:complete len:223 (-) Transcript_4139:1008-1676(-)